MEVRHDVGGDAEAGAVAAGLELGCRLRYQRPSPRVAAVGVVAGGGHQQLGPRVAVQVGVEQLVDRGDDPAGQATGQRLGRQSFERLDVVAQGRGATGLEVAVARTAMRCGRRSGGGGVGVSDGGVGHAWGDSAEGSSSEQRLTGRRFEPPPALQP